MFWIRYITSALSATWQLEAPLSKDDNLELKAANATRIAIIGAGIAASSTISKLLHNESAESFSITVFEREPIVGGRIRSKVHPYGELGAVEDGAAYFTADDSCLLGIINKSNLQHGALLPDGRGFPFRWPSTQTSLCNVETTKWRQIRDLFWMYGQSFWRARIKLRDTITKWQSLLSSGDDAMDIGEILNQAGIEAELFMLAQDFFEQYRISNLFQHDVLSSCSKARINQHTAETTALSALLAARDTEMTGVINGNAQMVEKSLAPVEVLLNSEVKSITLGRERKYSIGFHDTDRQLRHSDFDMIVIATPLGISGISIDVPASVLTREAYVPYTERHVTYLSSNQQPLSSSARYDYLDVQEMSDSILTAGHTREVNIDAIQVAYQEEGDRDCGIDEDCDTWPYKNIFRIVSRRRLSDTDLIDLVDQAPGSGRCTSNSSLADCDISWVHRHSWPHAFPTWQIGRYVPDSVQIAPGLFYTAGLDHIVSSMEMNCRMGRHVAAKIRNHLGPQVSGRL